VKSVDESLERSIHPDVTVERVHFPGRPWQTDLRGYSWFRGNFPAVSDRVWNKVEQAVFPERYAPWIPRVVRRIRTLHAQRPFDLILATGNPYSAFAAAWAAGRMLRVPYVIDYRDSWTLDQFGEKPAFEEDSPVWRWERRLVEGAARTVFVNQAQLEWHAERYPAAADRMRVVENGYDPEVFGATADELRVGDDRPLRFGYIGTITQQLPLEEFFEGWRLARKAPELAGAEARMYGHLGFFPNQTRRILGALPVEEGIGVSYEGPVPKASIADVYDELDVLLMIIPSSKYVTAGKVYEYMAAGKPIVTVHEPWTGARLPLEGYPLAFTVDDLRPETLADALVAAAQQARRVDAETVRRAKEHAARFTRAAQLAPLEHELKEMVGA
jgi:glycosyltransferase involved in cell wall biosynthesis